MAERSTRNSRLAQGALQLVLVAVAYLAAGKAALLMAIPPGYATAVFPSAGIAVAAVLLWGSPMAVAVFAGSFGLNLWIGLESGPLTTTGLSIAGLAATGAALQALLGAHLVRRFVGFPDPLSRERRILGFMLLAGPVACLTNASVAVTVLWATGVIPAEAYLFSWFTWWVGDSIGVLIAAPLVFIGFAQPRPLWRGRLANTGLPLLLATATVITLFYAASAWERERTGTAFEHAASDASEKIRFRMRAYLNATAYLERYIASASQPVLNGHFRQFVAFPLSAQPGIQALSWNPRITRAHRLQFEQDLQAQGFAGFQITERDGEGKPIPAAERDEYIPVAYIEPYESNIAAHGFDVSSNAARRQTLSQARDEGTPRATARITLVQASSEQAGFLLFRPVYRGNPETVEQRREALQGFSVGVFRVGDIIESILSEQHYRRDMVVAVADVSDGEHTPLWGDAPGSDLAWHTFAMDVGGRQWTIRYWPTETFMRAHRSWFSWALGAGGLTLASLLGVLLLAMSGRARDMQDLASRRTAELGDILSTAIEAIITLDADGRIESINPAGESLLGYPASELLNRPINTVIPGLLHFGAQSSLVAGTGSAPLANRRDATVIRKDGASVAIELAISATKLPDRWIQTVILHDLTDRLRSEHLKDEFISTVSHELRTPLTSIGGALSLLSSNPEGLTPEKKQSLLAIAADNTQRLTRLVNDLLTFNKLSLGHKTLALETVRLATLLEQAIAANHGYAMTFGVDLSLDSVHGDVCLRVDMDKMMQVMANLLSNAVKYSPREGTVSISTQCSTDEVRISVADSGPGIPPEFQHRVFDRFAQADSSNTRRVGGTGLGMAITKELVEMHGGRISFTTEQGRGTTFHIDLPLAHADAAAQQVAG